MRTLSGRTVAILEGRQGGDIAAMVERLGGTAVNAPAVRERPTDVDVGPLLERLSAGVYQVVVIQTGAGITALFDAASERGVIDRTRAALARAVIICRGPKPLAALKRQNLAATYVTSKPHTTRELIDVLDPLVHTNAPVMLLHYGERNAAITEFLIGRGAPVDDVCLYEWALPEDTSPLHAVVTKTIAGGIDAMLFTSQVQIRFLLEIAAEAGLGPELLRALNEETVVGAVGPVCASALRDRGVVADVLPAQSNSACLVGAVADYFELVGR